MRVSIQQFQQLNQVFNSSLSDYDKSLSFVSIVTGKAVSEIEKMPLDKINKVCSNVIGVFNYTYSKDIKSGKPKGFVKANGQWYELHYNITKEPFNAGRYVEIATFSNNIVGNLHKILASIATPVKYSWTKFKFIPEKELTKYPHERIALDMLNVDVSVAYHAAVFFCIVFMESIQSTQHYLMEISTDKMKMEDYLKNLRKILDGYTLPYWYQKWKDAHLNKHGEYQLSNT